MFSNLNDLLGIWIVFIFMQVYHIVSILLIIEYILIAATTNFSVFHVKFLVQLILNLCELFLGIKITMNQFSHDIRATAGQGSASWIDFLMDLWCILSKKLKISSIAPEAEGLPHKSYEKELMIKIAWLSKLALMKTWKVEALRPYDALFVFLQFFWKTSIAFATEEKWLLPWIFLILATTTNGRETWRFNCMPTDSIGLHWTPK